MVRGQFPYLGEHITRKKEIYQRYREGFRGLPVSMNPYDVSHSSPNFWLSCLIVEESAMCRTARGDRETVYESAPGKSCPDEILEALKSFNAEGRPIWKPMHMQPMYRMNPFVTVSGSGRGRSNAYLEGAGAPDAGAVGPQDDGRRAGEGDGDCAEVF